jgi:hypothetical protein
MAVEVRGIGGLVILIGWLSNGSRAVGSKRKANFIICCMTA